MDGEFAKFTLGSRYVYAKAGESLKQTLLKVRGKFLMQYAISVPGLASNLIINGENMTGEEIVEAKEYILEEKGE